MIDKILHAIWIVYLLVGIVFLFVAPKPDDATVLMNTTSGRSCEVPGTALVLAWPYYMHYFYRGGYAACNSGR